MFGFNYTYISSFEILKKMTRIFDYTIMEWSIIGWFTLWTIVLIVLIIPYFYILFITHKQNIEQKNRQKMMDRIILQKNLEDVITKEINEKSNFNNYQK